LGALVRIAMTGLLTRALKRSTVQVDTKTPAGVSEPENQSPPRSGASENIYPTTPIRREPGMAEP
jgi:hypothetical protein